MDDSYYEEIHGQLMGLFIALEGRLVGPLDLVEEFLDHNELGLAHEYMVRALAQNETPISDEERDGIVSVARAMGMEEAAFDALASCPRRP